MSVIQIDGAQFALHAVGQGVSIVDDMPGMAGLLLVVRKLIDDGVGHSRSSPARALSCPSLRAGGPWLTKTSTSLRMGLCTGCA
jgi:hypothetical protein